MKYLSSTSDLFDETYFDMSQKYNKYNNENEW